MEDYVKVDGMPVDTFASHIGRLSLTLNMGSN